MNFPAYETLQWVEANWLWLLIGWFGLSLLLTPFIARFAGMNRKGDQIAAAQAQHIRPMSHTSNERIISMDDPDYSKQIAALYEDHGGES